MLQRIFFLLWLFMGTAFISLAQESESVADSMSVYNDIFSSLQDNSRGGKIEIYQDPALHVLVDKSIRINKKEGLDGYRIQIFSSSGQDARDKVNEIQQQFLEMFPDFDARLIYTEYTAPYFKLRIGDFRNKNEAYAFFHKLRKKFPSSYIVKSKINFPKLEADQL